ncbi:MAG: type II toxin-antitoxin system VapB family antitoxin [Proteobacteria bacterium]|nr:type II toxin-antitoxin system VapB family antitoxin [Pseudomonadota bacterium]
MSLNIKNPATVVLADELARRQGVSKTAAIHQALNEHLHRLGYNDRAEASRFAGLRPIHQEGLMSPRASASRRRQRAGQADHPGRYARRWLGRYASIRAG